jgi:hypothetical protein
MISGTKVNVVEGGVGELNGQAIMWFGSGDRLSPGVSAYVELATRPALIAFGTADTPFGPPGEVEVMAP